MDSLYQYRQRIARKLKKRLSYLEKQYADDPTIGTTDVIAEVRQIEGLLKQIQQEPEKHKFPNFSVRDSPNDAWYRDVMFYWITQHPESGLTTGEKSTMYKFLLHFFVDHIVLNPQSSALTYNNLVQKVERLNQIDPSLREINYMLKDIRKLTSFIAAMQFEENTLPINARQLMPNVFGELETEINERSRLGMALAEYDKVRNRDLWNKRNRQESDGLEFDHE